MCPGTHEAIWGSRLPCRQKPTSSPFLSPHIHSKSIFEQTYHHVFLASIRHEQQCRSTQPIFEVAGTSCRGSDPSDAMAAAAALRPEDGLAFAADPVQSFRSQCHQDIHGRRQPLHWVRTQVVTALVRTIIRARLSIEARIVPTCRRSITTVNKNTFALRYITLRHPCARVDPIVHYYYVSI